jgi:hypothetical protein
VPVAWVEEPPCPEALAGAVFPGVGPLADVVDAGAVVPLADVVDAGAVVPLADVVDAGAVVCELPGEAEVADAPPWSVVVALWLWKLRTPARPAAVALMTSG